MSSLNDPGSASCRGYQIHRVQTVALEKVEVEEQVRMNGSHADYVPAHSVFDKPPTRGHHATRAGDELEIGQRCLFVRPQLLRNNMFQRVDNLLVGRPPALELFGGRWLVDGMPERPRQPVAGGASAG